MSQLHQTQSVSKLKQIKLSSICVTSKGYEKVNSVNKKCWINFFNVPENKRLVSEHVTIVHVCVCMRACIREKERKYTLNVNNMKSYL